MFFDLPSHLGHEMTQYDTRGRFIRRARYSAALAGIWALQVPNGRIEQHAAKNPIIQPSKGRR